MVYAKRLPESYVCMCACVYAKPEKGNIVYILAAYVFYIRSLALVTLSSYVASSIGYNGMKLRIELVSRKRRTFMKKQ